MINRKDLKYVGISGVFAGASIAAPAFPEIIAFVIALLGVYAIVMWVGAGILACPDLYMFDRSKLEIYRNPLLQSLTLILLGLFVYTLFTQGFLFAAGFFSFMLGMLATTLIVAIYGLARS